MEYLSPIFWSFWRASSTILLLITITVNVICGVFIMKEKIKVNGKVKDSRYLKESIKKLIDENKEVFDKLSEH